MGRGGFRIRQKSTREKWEKHLARKGVKLYGTRWCAMCSKQKAVLSQLCTRWEQFYVDCDSLRNVLECSTVKKIPAWRVAGKWYIGAQSEISLKQLTESTGQGMQRWDVAEFTRRHRRRGKWAKEEFSDVVKRSILKARATAATAPSPVVHSPEVNSTPQSAKGLNDTRGFMAHSAARGLIVFALAAATFTQENFQKFLQATNLKGAPFQKRSASYTSTRATDTTSHVESNENLKNAEQKLAPAAPIELEKSEPIVCKDEHMPGQDHYSRHLNNSVGTFQIFRRKRRLSARGPLTENMAKGKDSIQCPDEVAQKKVVHLHELLRFSEASGVKLRKSFSTILEGFCSGLQNLNSMGGRLTASAFPCKLKPLEIGHSCGKADCGQTDNRFRNFSTAIRIFQ